MSNSYEPATPLDILQAYTEGCEIYARFRDGKITEEQRKEELADLYKRYEQASPPTRGYTRPAYTGTLP